MPYEKKRSDVQRMFGDIAPRYDITNTVLSLGIHHFWRRTLLRLVPARPSRSEDRPALVLDMCTGTGDLLPLLKHRFGEVVGADFCFPMLAAGRTKLGARYALVQGDGLSLPFPAEIFDIVTVAFGVRNFENLEAGLCEIRRVLKPGSRLLVLEFGQPKPGLFGKLFRFYSSHVMPMLGGIITGNREAYSYLPQTSASFPCGEAFCNVLKSCGYEVEKSKVLTGGVAYAYCARK